MTVIKHAVAALVLAASVSSAAFAQGDSADKQNLNNNTMTFTTTDGTITKKPVSETAMAEMMKNGAMPMTDGVMMMKHQGKMYMVHDKKMANGKMMSDMAMGH